MCVQIWVVPSIEGLPDIVKLYLDQPLLFWGRLLDPEDDLRTRVKLLIADGAHRRYTAIRLLLKKMRVCFAKPIISFGEVVNTLAHDMHSFR
jgi:hypothetical protein